ncbi:MAG: glycosyl hydrolase family 57, partial [Candidatus Omnitrophota bacterium]
EEYAAKKLAPFVLQIGDGENGGVMMNEFPPMYTKSYYEMNEKTVGLNGSEYLEFIQAQGLKLKDFIPVEPVSQHRIWELVKDYHPGSCDEAIKKIHEQDSRYNLDKGSWTNDRSWVKGYEHVLDPMHKLSVAFHAAFDGRKVNVQNMRYRKALLHLLLSQTSCFRYWGTGLWTGYAQEIIRRGMEALSA